MKLPFIVRRLAVFAACVCAAAACDRDETDAAGPVRIDTANAQWEDGLSAEQVAESAEPMSPEQAAQAGLDVDTTIHLEQLDTRDSLPAVGAPPVQDPTLGGSGTLDGPDADAFPTPPAAPAPATRP